MCTAKPGLQFWHARARTYASALQRSMGALTTNPNLLLERGTDAVPAPAVAAPHNSDSGTRSACAEVQKTASENMGKPSYWDCGVRLGASPKPQAAPAALPKPPAAAGASPKSQAAPVTSPKPQVAQVASLKLQAAPAASPKPQAALCAGLKLQAAPCTGSKPQVASCAGSKTQAAPCTGLNPQVDPKPQADLKAMAAPALTTKPLDPPGLTPPAAPGDFPPVVLSTVFAFSRRAFRLSVFPLPTQ